MLQFFMIFQNCSLGTTRLMLAQASDLFKKKTILLNSSKNIDLAK